MGESGWFVAGLVTGLLVGTMLGIVIAGGLKQSSASVIFERDKTGKIMGVHYVPGKLA